MHRSPLPNYLRTFRKRACLTQQETAFLIGSGSGAHVCRQERYRQTPHLRTLLAYEFLHRTPIRDLYGGVAEEAERGVKKRIRILIRKLTGQKPTRRTARKLAFLDALLGGVPPPRTS